MIAAAGYRAGGDDDEMLTRSPTSAPELRCATRLVRDRRGAAAVEFALIAPVLLLLLAGLTDGSRFIRQAMQVNAAAQAGADWALRNGWNVDGINRAVTTATAAPAVATPAPVLVKGCVSGQAIVAAAGSTCPAGGAPGQWVTVSAQLAFKPLLPWPGVSLPSQTAATALVRIP